MNKFSTSLVYFCVIFSAILLLGSYQSVEAFAVQNGRREIKDSMVKDLVAFFMVLRFKTYFGDVMAHVMAL